MWVREWPGLQGSHWSLDEEPLPSAQGPSHSDLCQDGHMKTVPGSDWRAPGGFVRRCTRTIWILVLHLPPDFMSCTEF